MQVLLKESEHGRVRRDSQQRMDYKAEYYAREKERMGQGGPKPEGGPGQDAELTDEEAAKYANAPMV